MMPSGLPLLERWGTGEKRLGHLRGCVSTFALALVLAQLVGACAHHMRLPVVGTVYDSRNQPITGVVITISRSDGEQSTSQCVNVTRDKGEFTCNSLDGSPFKQNRTYTIVLEKDGYKPFSTQFQYAEEEERRLIFTLKEPGEVGEGEMGSRVEEISTGSARRRPSDTVQ